MEKTSREKQFTIVGKVVRQSKAKGVLIKVVWSKQNDEGRLHKTERNRIDFVDKLKWKWGVWFGNGNNSYIA